MTDNSKKNLITSLSIIGGAVIIAGAVVFVGQTLKIGENPGTAALVQPEESSAVISIEGEPILGDPNAKVLMVEVSDFQCPYCANYALNTFPEIKKEYVDTGKVKIVFKNFPLPFHPFAQKAAEAGDCVKEQGKFWEYKEDLFNNQQNISIDDLKKYAKDLGLDVQRFDSCLDSGKFEEKVKKDVQEAIGAGVEGTPTFFINGEKFVGALPFSEFQKIIDQALTK